LDEPDSEDDEAAIQDLVLAQYEKVLIQIAE